MNEFNLVHLFKCEYIEVERVLSENCVKTTFLRSFVFLIRIFFLKEHHIFCGAGGREYWLTEATGSFEKKYYIRRYLLTGSCDIETFPCRLLRYQPALCV